MSETPVTARPPYMLSMRNIHEANRKAVELIAKNNIAGVNPVGMPRNDAHRAALVKRLFDSILDLSNTLEHSKSQHYKYIASADRFPSEVVELTCWRLLDHLEHSQAGICDIDPWFTTEGPSYQAYDSFMGRFEDVVKGLKESKALCCSLFLIAQFSARLSWNPKKEHKVYRANIALDAISSMTNLLIAKGN
ncbi:hypothetical protein ONZ43_g6459 [Nemania bipapillata]|uniref:Uncharacterized protein n=1 Tax=Nemania bipapillata TaxID=110536 RepID=A0ACC2I048_9PEZI|nr:hypothetical protein ONZ43_g6459 [Nemania bipapillata]